MVLTGVDAREVARLLTSVDGGTGSAVRMETGEELVVSPRGTTGKRPRWRAEGTPGFAYWRGQPDEQRDADGDDPQTGSKTSQRVDQEPGLGLDGRADLAYSIRAK